MSLSNLNNQHLTTQQEKAIMDGLDVLEQAAAPVTANLVPEDRSQYGTINEMNKLLVNKSSDFYHDTPHTSSPEVDWEEFERDYRSRAFYENAINRLDALRLKFLSAKILHDYDNYQAALEDYAYTKYRAQGNAQGFETKYNEMKQFFARTKKSGGESGSEAQHPAP